MPLTTAASLAPPAALPAAPPSANVVAPATPPPEPTEKDRVKAAISAMQGDAPAPPVPAPAPESAKPPVPPEPPKETPDDIVAAAGRERAAIRDTAAKLRAREEAIEKEAADIAALRAEMKADPIAFMDKHAGPEWYRDATKRFLNKGQPAPEEVIRTQAQEIAELRQRVDQIQSGFSMQPYERQAEQYLAGLQSALSKPEYAIVAEDPDAVEKVHRIVLEHAQRTQAFLPIEDALGRVRTEQVERARKLSARLQAEQPPPAPAPVQVQQPIQTPAGTLTTKTQSPRATPPTESEDDDFDAAARKRRAIAALTGGEAGGN